MSEEIVPRPPGGEAQPQQPAADPADAAKTRRLNNATTFLKNPQVRASPLSRRVNFLKSKGLSAEEIVEAFSRAGQVQSLESIQNIINNQNASKTAVSAAQAAAPAVPTTTHGAPHAGQPNVVYVQGPPTGQYQQHPQQPPKPPAWGWKDYFIGATLATVGAIGAAQAVKHFAPFEFVWKDNNTRSEPQRKSSRRKLKARQPTSSDSDSSVVQQPRKSKASKPSVAESAPLATSAPAAPEAPAAAKTNEEVENLKKEVTELTEQLEKARKDKAEMAVSSAKVKGQVTQLSRANEKSTAEIARLAAENAKLKEENEKLKTEASLQPKPAASDEKAEDASQETPETKNEEETPLKPVEETTSSTSPLNSKTDTEAPASPQ